MENDLLKGLTFNYTKLGEKLNEYNLPKILEGKPLTLYAKLNNPDIQIPVKYYDEVHKIITSKDRNLSIKIDDKVYYDKYSVISKFDMIEICIGNSMKLIFPNTNQLDRLKKS